jgi:hypothetical protein
MFSPGIFFFSSRRKEKKNHKKEKNVEKGWNFLSSSHFALSLLAPVFALPILPFCFKHFFLASSFSQAKESKKKTKKKNHRKEKKCREGRELTFKLSFYLFTFGSHFYPFISTFSFQAFSSEHFLFLK